MRSSITSKYLNSIFESISISYIRNGELIPVQQDILDDFRICHSKVVKQLYLELLLPKGQSRFVVMGAITYPINKSAVLGMALKGEFMSDKGKLQIWINNKFKEKVKVIIPSNSELLYMSSKNYKNQNKKDMCGGKNQCNVRTI